MNLFAIFRQFASFEVGLDAIPEAFACQRFDSDQIIWARTGSVVKYFRAPFNISFYKMSH